MEPYFKKDVSLLLALCLLVLALSSYLTSQNRTNKNLEPAHQQVTQQKSIAQAAVTVRAEH